jgi:serine/threonine protein kinase
LVGQTLNGWRVVEWLQKTPDRTGGFFSEAYIVEDKDGNQAFLKALDLSRALVTPDAPREIQRMLEGFNFERDVHQLCENRRLNRIVKSLDSGTINLTPDMNGMVPCLILEKAEGDLRSKINRLTAAGVFDAVLSLRILHQVANGLRQLHGVQIAHQDIKPSNVVVFGEQDSRITDLGTASLQSRVSPRDGFRVAGDMSYTPPELLYGSVSPEWHIRRLGCDAYMLGSLAVYLFTGISINSMIFKEIPMQQHFDYWGGSYVDVLPIVRAAFGVALKKASDEFKKSEVDELTEVVRQLCEPDPMFRGHPKGLGNGSAQFSMERYVSKFDLMAKRLEATALKNP